MSRLKIKLAKTAKAFKIPKAMRIRLKKGKSMLCKSKSKTNKA